MEDTGKANYEISMETSGQFQKFNLNVETARWMLLNKLFLM